MGPKDIAQLLVAFFALVVATGTAQVAINTFRFNARTKRAEFLLALHKAFFVDEGYKRVRDVLDGDTEADHNERLRFVTTEPSEFTDFLNFFELVIYMSVTKVLKRGQVEALLGYYLDSLSSRPELKAYILRADRGFENLAEYIRLRDIQRNRSN